MAALGQLVVSLTAETAQFRQSLDRATYQAQKNMQSIESYANTAAVAIAGMFSVSAINQAIRDTAAYGAEIKKLSDLSGLGTRQFQGLAYGAESVGISAEKLADIFKDVQDKVGDFLQTGGGPMKDFFENIAPKVGVTAQQFARLGGADALQLYVNSLQKANLSQNEMVFFMEAIASDATALLPLLKNNGQEFAKLADEAQRLGRILDEDTIAANKRFNEELRKFDSLTQAATRNIASALIPSINALIQEFISGTKHANGFLDAILTFGTMNPFKSQAENMKSIRAEIESLQSARERYIAANSDTTAIDQSLARAEKRLKYLQELEANTALLGTGNESGAESRRLGLTGPSTLADTVARKTKKQLEDEKKLADEILQLKREANMASGLQVISDNLEYQKNLQAEINDRVEIRRRWAAEEGDEVIRANEAYQTRLEALTSDTPIVKTQQLLDNVRFLDEAYMDGKISADLHAQAVANITGNVNALNNAQEQANSLGQDLGSAIANSFEQAIIQGQNLRNVMQGLLKDIIQIALRIMVTKPLEAALTNFFSTGGTMAGGRALGGAVKAGNSYLVGEKGPEVVTFGSDARITPNSDLGGNVVVNQTINVTTGVQQTVRAEIMTLMPQLANAAKAAVADAKLRGGSYASALR